MRVLINLLNFRPGRIGGTETYLRELIAHLPIAATDERITVLTSRDVAPEFRDADVEVVSVPLTTRQVCGLRFLETAVPWFRARSVEAVIARLHPDVVLFPQQSMFPRTVETPAVLVVHDLYHVQFPQYLSATQRWFRRRSYPAAIASADHVIAISEFTRRAVLQHFTCPPQCVSVVPHGVRRYSPHSIEPHEGIAGPYLYYPATTLPHKNHEVLFRTVAALRAAGRFSYRLVLTGAQTRHWKPLEKLLRKLSIDDIVCHLGYLPHDEVLRLMRGAECVVFPSRFEGFGIPVIEAASLDKKVITSQLEVFEEIGVPANCRIDFANADAFAATLADPSASRLVHPPATWTQTAAGTLAILRETAESRRVLPLRPQLAPATTGRVARRRAA